MSKNNNVNPGQYKVAGREKPDTLASERMKHRGSEKATNASRKPKAPKPKAR
jgi:hypothetical protein